uniref:Uncharacterized protein n=1 Tax=Arundo donax TaxID=35708 RepID=A0A0A9BDL1_ARUDO
MRYKIYPSEPRVVINKYYIIVMTTLGTKRRRTPYIRVNQIKRMKRNRLARTIR